MIYSKAATHFSKALDEMLEVNAEKPWEAIELELKKTLLADQSAMDQVIMMSDGALASLAIASAMAESTKGREDQETLAKAWMLEVVSAMILRAFAMGVHCQKSAAEVETLETLAKQ